MKSIGSVIFHTFTPHVFRRSHSVYHFIPQRGGAGDTDCDPRGLGGGDDSVVFEVEVPDAARHRQSTVHVSHAHTVPHHEAATALYSEYTHTHTHTHTNRHANTHTHTVVMMSLP